MINFRLIRHLWLFLAVAEEQNFGRAAKRRSRSSCSSAHAAAPS